MTARVNSAEGGTNGTAITTTNTAGASGNAFDSLAIPSGTTAQFSTAAAYKGTLGYRLTTGSGSGASVYKGWNVTGWPVVRFRFYMRITAYPTTQTYVAYTVDPSGWWRRAMLFLSPNGRWGIEDTSGNTLWNGSTVVPLNTWVRVEFLAVPGTRASNGSIRFWWATGDGAVTESLSTSANTGTEGSFGRLYWGKLSGSWNTTLDLDDYAADDASTTTAIGPSAASGTPVVVDPTPPPGAPTAERPDLYAAAIRSSVDISWTVSAKLAEQPVPGASGLAPVSGSITDTNKPGARRVLNVDLAPPPGMSGQALFDLLEPVGTLLTVSAHVRITGGIVVDVPMGVFDIDTVKLTEGEPKVSVTAPDKWVRVQRSKLPLPTASTVGARVVDQAAQLISAATGEPVQIDATSQALVGPMVWESDREKAVLDLLDGIGAWVYFDRNGTCVIADVPTSGSEVVWSVDASSTGVLLSLDRERSRTETRNVIVVTSSAADEEKFPTQVVWDNDVNSPTYAGPDPINNPAAAGEFGLSVDFLDTALPLSAEDARTAGGAQLQRKTGISSQVSLSMVPNPAIDSFDVIDVLPPKPDRNTARFIERHIVDTITHPLAVGSPTTIDGRAIGTAGT